MKPLEAAEARSFPAKKGRGLSESLRSKGEFRSPRQRLSSAGHRAIRQRTALPARSATAHAGAVAGRGGGGRESRSTASAARSATRVQAGGWMRPAPLGPSGEDKDIRNKQRGPETRQSPAGEALRHQQCQPAATQKQMSHPQNGERQKAFAAEAAPTNEKALL